MSFLDALPDYGQQAQAQPVAQSGASFLDQLPDYSGKSADMGDAPTPQADNRTVMEKLTGSGGQRYQLWPERLARELFSSAGNAVTAPGRAYQQGLTPEEEIKAGVDTAMLFNPANPAVTAGDRLIPGITRTAAPVPPAGLGAAETAAGLGAPLPVGIASDSKPVQAITQAARQLPIVGQKIDSQTGKAVGAAGDAVQSVADELGGGITDRAATGAVLRPSLSGVIEANNGKISDAYSALRGVLDPAASPAQLPRTSAVLDDIIKQRSAAGQRNPLSGLEDVDNLVKTGATFDGIQRARSDIGNSLEFGDANPGFNKGDLKRVYAAMSADMDSVVRSGVKPGIDSSVASSALKSANETASPLFAFNKSIQQLLNIKSDEGLAGSVVKSAQDKTGNVRLLAQLRSTMPPEDFQQIAGTALNELGHNASTGKFSLSQFSTQWDKLGDRAKGVLFSSDHRQYLDNIAALGRHLKDADKYANTSGTGRAAMLGSLVTGVTTAGVHALGGDVMPLVEALGAMGGGYALASVLSRPAAAASMAQWSRTVLAQSRAPSPARSAALTVATRNLVSNLSDVLKISPSEVVRQLQAPMKSAADPNEPSNVGLPAK